MTAARSVSWTRGPHRLVVADGRFVLTDGAGTLDGEGPDALDAARGRIEAAVGWTAFVEAGAAVAHPERMAPFHPAPRRSRVKRFHGRSGRGVVAPHVHIHGRHVRGRGPDGLRWESTLEEAAATGLPDALRQALGDADADAVLDAVHTLRAADCDCGEAEAPGHHRTLRTLASEQYPRAPMDDRTVVGACTVCGRLWTFRTTGDSHYGYTHRVEPFSGSFA